MEMGSLLMARFAFKGLDEYALKLSRLQSRRVETIGRAIYKAADIVANEISEKIDALPERKPGTYGTAENPARGVLAIQKAGLKHGFGITPMREENGYYNVKLGFAGYNRLKSAKYPNGQPNQLVARGIESGTSWLQKSPFVNPAVKKTKEASIKAMQKVIDDEAEETMK